MAKQQTDEEPNLRRKARRRLIGAIALTLAVVVILPMVLDSEPRRISQDIELRIPDPDKVGEFIPGGGEAEVADVSSYSMPDLADELPPEAASDVPLTDSAKPSMNVDGSIRTQSVADKQPESGVVDKSAAIDIYVVQVGAYANAEAARKQLEQLKKWSFKKAYTEKVGDNVRVRVGPYSERKDAEHVLQLLEKHDLKPIVMSAN